MSSSISAFPGALVCVVYGMILLSLCNYQTFNVYTVKPLNNGHFGGSNVVRCREVVPISEVIVEATPLNNGLDGYGLSLTAHGHREQRH